MNSPCPFCNVLANKEFITENAHAVAFLDKFPVTEGHILIVPKRHVADYFETTEEERIAIGDMLVQLRQDIIENDHSVEGFNIGINIGEAAGQTVFHCHVHLIPRRRGDTPHPHGGVRGVIPDKMQYRKF